MKLSALKVVRDISDGCWVDDIPAMPGLRLKVRPFGNHDDKRVQAEELEKLPTAARMRGRVDQDALMTRRLIGAVLTGWDGLEDDAGAPLEYSPDTAELLLNDPELASFRDAVIWAAMLAGAEATEKQKTSAKN